jgi:uncharacterized cupredoxin-like copper-binding protein
MRSGLLRLSCLAALVLFVTSCQGTQGAGADSSTPRERIIELTMEGMRFIPDRIEVELGETVRFVVQNPDLIPHEVLIGSEAEQLEHHDAHASAPPADQANVPHYGYGLYVPARGTGQFVYRFDSPGEVMIGCHLPGHWEAGMKATIVVGG